VTEAQPKNVLKDQMDPELAAWKHAYEKSTVENVVSGMHVLPG
jgi:hypothetical protein